MFGRSVNPSRRLWFLLLSVSLAVVVVALIPELAWARAGDGGSFGGGGGGGGSGGFGGSGGDGGIAEALIYLCWRYPLIGYPLVAIIVASMIFGGHEARERHVTRTIRRGRQKQSDRLREEALNAIRQRDPSFDLDQFLDRAGTAFRKIQSAWSEQNLSPVRAFVSDGIHERFSLQIGMQQAEGYRNAVEQVRIQSVEAVAVESSPAFDTIHVRIAASAVDYRVDLNSGKVLSGTKRSESFVEFWSFHRRPGARTLSGSGCVEGNCPRCSAPLKIVDRAECDACGAHVNSGEFDWVMAEITQDEEWVVGHAEAAAPGVPELKQRDPAFSVQHIEDRVSVMFWRMRAAEFYRDASLAEPILLPEYRDRVSDQLLDARSWRDPAVGRVELIDAIPGDERTPDRLRVNVRWSGTLIDRSGNGQRIVRSQTIYTHVFTLLRNHGVRSVPQETFTSAGCFSCGAPARVNRSGDCVYCGAELTTGTHDWGLADVQPYTSVMAYGEEGEMRRRTIMDREGVFEKGTVDNRLPLIVMAQVMLIDGHLHNKELRALQRLGAHRGMSPDEVQSIIRSAMNGTAQKSRLPLPEDSRQAAAHLEQVVHAVLADGQLSRPEKRLLQRYARKTGLTSADLRLALARERKRAYQAARKELRSRA
jgi:uncharacterized tellurite resistance protein B-like protein